jgi:SAM-dependent methyltransferase
VSDDLTPRMTTAEAIQQLRADPDHGELIRDSYLDEDAREAAERFEASAEFDEIRSQLSGQLGGGRVLDLGAGTGIASYALARAGAHVYALEPDPSPVVGRGALERLTVEGVEILDGVGESIPLADESVDAVYCRQVLHHIQDLEVVAREIRRVLRPGGVFLACREHVVNSPEDLETFLAGHQVHQLAGGEGAYPLEEYLDAMRRGGLEIRRVWGPLDTVVNAFPFVRSEEELRRFRSEVLGRPLAALGGTAERVPGVRSIVRRRLEPYVSVPGSMWSFLAERPG